MTKEEREREELWDAFQEALTYMNEDNKNQAVCQLVTLLQLKDKTKVQVQVVVTKIKSDFMEYDTAITKTVYDFSKKADQQ